MKLQTASSVISFAKSLETESAKFYEGLAQRYTQGKDAFLSFAKENSRNVAEIERAYYGVITDAIEGCFSFDIGPDAYAIETTLAKAASYSAALAKAIELEEKIGKFYSDAAEQPKSLMADVPRVFTLIARKRGERGAKLRSFLGKKG